MQQALSYERSPVRLAQNRRCPAGLRRPKRHGISCFESCRFPRPLAAVWHGLRAWRDKKRAEVRQRRKEKARICFYATRFMWRHLSFGSCNLRRQLFGKNRFHCKKSNMYATGLSLKWKILPCLHWWRKHYCYASWRSSSNVSPCNMCKGAQRWKQDINNTMAVKAGD